MIDFILIMILIAVIILAINVGSYEETEPNNSNDKGCNDINTMKSNSTISTGLLIVLCLLLSPIAYCFLKVIAWCYL